jgi:transcription initiation factor TFIIA small subunit
MSGGLQFDKSMNEALETQVKSKMNFKGHLHTYRFCDNVWTFLLENAEFRVSVPGGPMETVRVDKVKIVACDGKIGK